VCPSAVELQSSGSQTAVQSNRSPIVVITTAYPPTRPPSDENIVFPDWATGKQLTRQRDVRRRGRGIVHVARSPVAAVRHGTSEAGGGGRDEGSWRQATLGDQVPAVLQQRQSAVALVLRQPAPQHRRSTS